MRLVAAMPLNWREQNAVFNFSRKLVSDHHRGIAQWIRTSQPFTSDVYDLWHVARSISKKLIKVSLETDCTRIKSWIKGIRKHLYWCATSTKQGFGAMIVAKWKSFMRHVADRHKDHGNSLFNECPHGELEPRKWIKISMMY